MPNSLKCKIKHLYHNRTITERERDRLLKALEQESVLDKIRAKIKQKAEDYNKLDAYKCVHGLCIALEIIDKYKAAESEGKE